MLEGLLNDRTLVRDEQHARPLEVIQKDRLRAVDTLFGVIKIKRRYYYHTNARTGRCPLDESLDLVRGHTPGLARIICHASTHSSSFEEAAESLHAYLGLRLAGRNFGRMVAEITPVLRDAQATLPAAKDEAHSRFLFPPWPGVSTNKSPVAKSTIPCADALPGALLEGVEAPLVLDLLGDCAPDLAGCTLTFEKPGASAIRGRLPSFHDSGRLCRRHHCVTERQGIRPPARRRDGTHPAR